MMTTCSFEGLRVLALESRRAQEIGKLIANYGGEPVVAPSVKEVQLESNPEALEFVRRLVAKQVDMVIFTTGSGVRALAKAVEPTCPAEKLATLLNQAPIIARGPKPVAALRELGVRASLIVPEPNTWRELLALLDEMKSVLPLAGRRVAVQEYGVLNPELSDGLVARGATVIHVSVYQWALPDDITPLQEAILAVIRGTIDVVLVASSIQIRHLFQVAANMGKQDLLQKHLAATVVVSIGPVTSEELRSRGLTIDLECTRPRMGSLVQEAAEHSSRIRRLKQPLR